MNIEILDDAQQDLLEGFHFYERSEAGLGSFFFDSLLSDIVGRVPPTSCCA